jgi:hypothetical protein
VGGKPNLSRQDSWQSSLEGGGYETAKEELDESERLSGGAAADSRPAAEPAAGASSSSTSSSAASTSGTTDPIDNKWSCIDRAGGGGASASASGAADALSVASVPPSPAIPRAADDPEAVQDALKQVLHQADGRYSEQSFEEAHALLLTQARRSPRSSPPRLHPRRRLLLRCPPLLPSSPPPPWPPAPPAPHRLDLQVEVGGAEVAWRLARICKEIAQVAGATGGAAGKARERELLLEGLKYAEEALKADGAPTGESSNPRLRPPTAALQLTLARCLGADQSRQPLRDAQVVRDPGVAHLRLRGHQGDHPEVLRVQAAL